MERTADRAGTAQGFYLEFFMGKTNSTVEQEIPWSRRG